MSKADQFNTEVQKCTSVKEIFDCIEKYYDIENCKPGQIVKVTVINGLKTAINLLKPKLR